MVRTAANGTIASRNVLKPVGEEEPSGGGVDTVLKRRMMLGMPLILTPTPVPDATPDAFWRFAMLGLYRQP